MGEKRFIFATNEKWFLFDNETEDYMDMEDCKDKLNEQQEQLDLYKEAILTMLGLLADKGILFSGVKDERGCKNSKRRVRM